MVKYEDIKEKLVLESVRTINHTGLRHLAGADWSWVRGMIRHHLPILRQRIESSGLYDLAEEHLSMDGERVICDYLKECLNYLPEPARILDFFTRIGIYPGIDQIK